MYRETQHPRTNAPPETQTGTQTGEAERAPERQRYASVCPHDCPSACALEVEKETETRIGAIYGSQRNSFTDGVVCTKVATYAERVHHPDRLTVPLRRVGEKGAGRFEPLAWSDALDAIAEHFVQAEQTYDKTSIWPYSYYGTMGLVQGKALERFRHVGGYSSQKNTICSAMIREGWKAATGGTRGPDLLEIREADLILVWGGNPVHTHVNLMRHISWARKNRGAKLVVIDPYETPTAKLADMHLAPRPGTDTALALAVGHVMVREKYIDRPYLDQYADDPAGMIAHLEDKTPQWASQLTGVPAADIEALACLYGRTARAFIRLGWGFSRQRNGPMQVHAVATLPTLGGKWRHRGGGAQAISSGSFDGLDYGSFLGTSQPHDGPGRFLDMSQLGRVLARDPQALRGGPPVLAMLVQNSNPADVCPDSQQVQAGLARSDVFLAVHEQFLTQTARFADIVLPATTFLEHDDIYDSYGHSWLQPSAACLAPTGETRENQWVVSQLAQRLGFGGEPCFQQTARQMIETFLKQNKLPNWKELTAQGGLNREQTFQESHFLNGFDHTDGKFHFWTPWNGRPALPETGLAHLENPSDAYPFRLVTAPARFFLNSSFNNLASGQQREKRPTLLLGASDAAQLGLEDGELVRLSSQTGTVRLHLKIFRGKLAPRTCICEGVWASDAFLDKIGINTLISQAPAKPDGGAAFHDCAVRIEKNPAM